MTTRRRTASGGSIKPLLGEETHKLVKFRAASMGISGSELIRTAVKHYMKTHAGFNGEPVVPGINDVGHSGHAVPGPYSDTGIARTVAPDYPENGGQEGGIP